jgi:iron complex outermembrane receptor protein
MRIKLSAVSQASLLAVLASGSALGQEAQPQTTAAESKLEEIVVTGTRILRKDDSSSSPVVTVGVDAIRETGSVTVENYLNTMPQFAEGSNAGTISIGGGLGATLNMRALGSTRNLVLLDQRRLPVANQFGVVDVNAVPPVMIQGVEVLTGGASSVYGSEAISGVVNFQSKDFFEGIEAHIEYGDTFDSVADVTDISVVGGASSASGRGRALLALSYTDRSALRGEDRDFFKFAIPSSFIGQGVFRSGGNAPNQAAVSALFQSYGITAVPQTDRLGFNDDGSLFTQGGGALNYQGPTADDTLFQVVNGTDVRQPVGRQGTALKALERYNAFAKLEYDLTDSITAYGQVLHSEGETSGSASLNITLFGPTALVPVTNPFIPTDLAALLATRPNATAPFILEQRFMGIGERIHNESLNTTQIVVGLSGETGLKDWRFDIYGAHDSTDAVETIENLSLASRLNQLLQAPDGGLSLCEGGFNPFGLANSMALSAECQQFMAPNDVSTTTVERSLLDASATGTLFSLPAGDVQASFSASYREDSVVYIPSISIITNDALGLAPSNPSSGETETVEVGGELLVPLFRDLNLTAGYRHSDQDVSGSGDSWNVGLEWRPIQSLFIRGSYQQAIRAPNIGELFSASLGAEFTVGDPTSSPNNGDPCDIRTASRMGPNGDDVEAICIAQGMAPGLVDTFQHTTTALPSSTGGNVNLDPETADTITFGFVWTPDLGSNDLSLTVDYWQITIDDVIKTIDGPAVLQRCFNPTFNPTLDPGNVFCQLVARGSATGTVTDVSTNFLNLASLETSGIDVQVNHAIDIGSTRLLTNASVGWLNNYEEQSLPNDPFLDYAGTIGGPANRVADNDVHPEWKLSLTPTLAFGPASLAVRWRYLSSMEARQVVVNPSATTPGVPSVSYFDVFGTYQFTDKMMLRAGVTNVFDEDPPEVSGQIGQTRIGTYDVLGPTFTIGLRASF